MAPLLPDSTSLPRAISELMMRIHHRLDARAFEMLATTDMTLTQLRVLKLLADADHPRPIFEIADQLALSLATAGRAVDYLVQHDVAKRWEDPHDRRSKLVELTSTGHALADAPHAAVEDQLTQFADSLPPAVAQALKEALICALNAE